MGIIPGIIIGAIFAWMGFDLFRMRGVMPKIGGAIICLIGGITLVFGATYDDSSTYKRLDHELCAQYVWLEDEWKCVPWEEAG